MPPFQLDSDDVGVVDAVPCGRGVVMVLARRPPAGTTASGLVAPIASSGRTRNGEVTNATSVIAIVGKAITPAAVARRVIGASPRRSQAE